MTPHQEIGAVLRSAIRGDIQVSAPKGMGDWWSSREPTFNIGGWELDCFVETGSIEEIYAVRAPDGREFEFPFEEGNSSMSLFLSDPEQEELCLKLGRPHI